MNTMNNIRLLTILALAASLTACQQEPQPQGPNGSGDTHKISLQAVFGDAPAVGTKVAIADTYGANFTWSAGDQIAVHSSDGSYHTLTLLTGAGEASATFEGELGGSQDYYAVYPATAKVDANYGNSTLQVTLPDSYTIDGSMGTTSQLPMIAVNTGNTLTFNHVGAIYRLTLDDVPAGTDKITVTFDKDVTGTFTVTDPGTAAPYIVTTAGSTGRTVTFNLSSPLTAETDGFVLNIPVPTGTYSGEIKVVTTGGSKLRAWFPNPRTITRASGRKLAGALIPAPAGFGGPFTYEGEEYYISQGNMYKTATGYALYDDWTGGLDQYGGTLPGTQTWTGNSYFNWVHLAGLFDTSINTGANENIDNDQTPISGCKLPTRLQWDAFADFYSVIRTGSTVNGTAECRFALIQLTGYTNGSISNPVGVLLIPDGLTMTGMSRTFTWNVESTSGNTGVTVAQVQEYIDRGCVFLPAAGYVNDDGTAFSNGGDRGYYWASTSWGNLYSWYISLHATYLGSGYIDKGRYHTVRLIREME